MEITSAKEVARVMREFRKVVKFHEGCLPYQIHQMWMKTIASLASEKKFYTGCLWEGNPWKIVFNVKGSDFDSRCKHSKHVTKYTYGVSHDDRILSACVFITPRAVSAYNEGGFCSTGICLDCILEKTSVNEWMECK